MPKHHKIFPEIIIFPIIVRQVIGISRSAAAGKRSASCLESSGEDGAGQRKGTHESGRRAEQRGAGNDGRPSWAGSSSAVVLGGHADSRVGRA